MGWNEIDKRMQKGPVNALMAWMPTTVVMVTIFAAFMVFAWAGTYVFSWFTESATVVRTEFGPKAMLKKYEWFKDASAQLDKKKADIKVYEQRMKGIVTSYGAVARPEWDRTDKEQYNIWMGEVAGVKASYNALAADYNAQMAKFNWSFANAGELPQGATDTLPREFKSYTQGE